LGARAPSRADLGFSHEHGVSKPTVFKAKAVCGAISLDSLVRLPMAPEVVAQLAEALMWVREGAHYAAIRAKLGDRRRTEKMREDVSGSTISLTSRAPLDRLSEERKGILCGMAKLIRWDDFILSFPTMDTEITVSAVDVFVVREEKEDVVAERPIFAPHINDILEEMGTDVSVVFSSRDDVRRGVAEGEVGCQFDLVACFDQIELAPSLWPLFAVGTASGQSSAPSRIGNLPPPPWLLRTLSMGFKPSVKVAVAVLDALCPPSLPSGVSAFKRVDNVLFTGPAEGVSAAAAEFVARCREVGAVLNEQRGLETQYSFLGEQYAHQGPGGLPATRALVGKTRAKVCLVAAFLGALAGSVVVPARRLASFVGLLLYAGETMRVSPAAFHWVLRFFAAVAREMALSGRPWSDSVEVPATIVTDLTRWAKEVSEASPRPVVDDATPLATITTDASAEGWGAISTTTTGTRTWSFRWTEEDAERWDLTSSVAAEPLAVWRALCAVVAPGARGTVVILSDHAGLVFAGRKGHGRARAYNFLLAKAREVFPDVKLDFAFVAGELNPADPLSRSFGCQPWIPPVLEVTAVAGVRRGCAWG
jgi:hypothetical protein